MFRFFRRCYRLLVRTKTARIEEVTDLESSMDGGNSTARPDGGRSVHDTAIDATIDGGDTGDKDNATTDDDDCNGDTDSGESSEDEEPVPRRFSKRRLPRRLGDVLSQTRADLEALLEDDDTDLPDDVENLDQVVDWMDEQGLLVAALKWIKDVKNRAAALEGEDHHGW